MKITSTREQEELVKCVERIITRLAQRGKAADASALREELQRYKDGRFQVVVMGKAKRGKSTFVNGVLGRSDDQIAPIDRLPATSTITRYIWDTKEEAKVTYQDGRQETISYSRIREFVTENEGCNPGNLKQVEVVDVSGPFPGLDRDLVLVDTPGAGSIHEHHDVVLYSVIPNADAVVFLVTARMPIDQDELDLLLKVKKADIRRFIFVINRIDEVKDPQDIISAVDHNKAILGELGMSCSTIHQISAKRAFEGDLSHSGFSALASDIHHLLNEERGLFFKNRLAEGLSKTIAPLLDSLRLQVELADRSAADVEAEAKRLEVAKAKVERDRERVEIEFNEAWAPAIDEFENGIQRLMTQTQDEVERRIKDTPTDALSEFAKNFPRFVSRAIEAKLAPHVDRLESALREACQKLDSRYPCLSVGEVGHMEVSVAEDRKPVFTAVALVGATVLLPFLPGVLLGSTIPLIGAFLGASLTTLLEMPALLLAGAGVWRTFRINEASKLKLREDMQDRGRKAIKAFFEELRYSRIPDLRRSGKALLEQNRRQLQKQILDLDTAIKSAAEGRLHPDEKASIQRELEQTQADHADLLKLLPRPAH